MILKKLQQAVPAAIILGFAVSLKAEETVNELLDQGEKSGTFDIYDLLIPIGCGLAVWSFATYKGGRPTDPRKAHMQLDLPIVLGTIAWIASNFLP